MYNKGTVSFEEWSTVVFSTLSLNKYLLKKVIILIINIKKRDLFIYNLIFIKTNRLLKRAKHSEKGSQISNGRLTTLNNLSKT